jgi:hypothetical protein
MIRERQSGNDLKPRRTRRGVPNAGGDFTPVSRMGSGSIDSSIEQSISNTALEFD